MAPVFGSTRTAFGSFGFEVLVGRIEFLLDDGLEAHVNREADIFAMLRFLFDAAIEHDFTAGAVALDVAISILAGELSIHREFDALHAFAIVVQKSEHMSKHFTIRVGADGILLRKKPTQFLLLHLVQQGDGFFFRNLALKDDVFFPGGKFFKDLLRIEAEVL